jgi:hypothetical protein
MGMLPPFFKSLGPAASWFCQWFLRTYSAKYADLTAATSLDKVSPAAPRKVPKIACRWLGGHRAAMHAHLDSACRDDLHQLPGNVCR